MGNGQWEDWDEFVIAYDTSGPYLLSRDYLISEDDIIEETSTEMGEASEQDAMNIDYSLDSVLHQPLTQSMTHHRDLETSNESSISDIGNELADSYDSFSQQVYEDVYVEHSFEEQCMEMASF